MPFFEDETTHIPRGGHSDVVGDFLGFSIHEQSDNGEFRHVYNQTPDGKRFTHDEVTSGAIKPQAVGIHITDGISDDGQRYLSNLYVLIPTELDASRKNYAEAELRHIPENIDVDKLGNVKALLLVNTNILPSEVKQAAITHLKSVAKKNGLEGISPALEESLAAPNQVEEAIRKIMEGDGVQHYAQKAEELRNQATALEKKRGEGAPEAKARFDELNRQAAKMDKTALENNLWGQREQARRGQGKNPGSERST